jgi:undecaprenyl-diphosphatase
MTARLRWSLVALCVVVLALLALQVVTHGPLAVFDEQASAYWMAHRTLGVTILMRVLSNLHQTWRVGLFAALVALALALRGQWISARALLVVPAGMLLNVALKDSFRRPRPHWEDPLVQLATFSFPSGHAVHATVFWGILCALVFVHTPSRLWRTLAFAWTVAIVAAVAFSRVYLGAHYPSDVLAGIAEGSALVLVFAARLRPAGRTER